jgi:hypothetical protein
MDKEADTQFLISYSSSSDSPRLKPIYDSNIFSKNVKSQNSNKICIKKSQIKFSKQIPLFSNNKINEAFNQTKESNIKVLKPVSIKTFNANFIPNACQVAVNPVVLMCNNFIGNGIKNNVSNNINFINPNLRNNFCEKKNVAPLQQLLIQQNRLPVKAFYHPIFNENFNKQSGQEINHDYQSSTITSISKIRIAKKVKNEKKVTANQIIQKAISQQLKQSNAALDSRSKCLNKSSLSRQVTSSQNQSNVLSNSNLSTRPNSSKINNTKILSNEQNASQLNLHKKQGSSPNVSRRGITRLSKGK